MKIKVIVIIILICVLKASAQQYPNYSQYTFDKYLVNPAVAGSEGYTSVNLVAREQWVGFKGTPKTHLLSAQARLSRNSFIFKNPAIRKKKESKNIIDKVGLGLNIFYDKSGPISQTSIKGTYAYHIPINEFQISLGLSLMIYQFRINGEEIVFSDGEPDNLVDEDKTKITTPDANWGIYISSDNYYGGLSVMQISRSALHLGGNYTGDDFRRNRYYNFLGGYYYPINEKFTLEPSFLLKISEKSSNQIDLSTKLIIDNKYWGGLSFRTGASMVIFGGLQYDIYFFGYAFDYTFNPVMRHTLGSHEFMAAIKIGDTVKRYKWLNRY